MAGQSLDLVQGAIYYFGVWEPNLTAFVNGRLKGQTRRTFIDVGANVGYFTLLAARHLRQGGVVAVEAFPSIYEKLAANVRLNKFRNIRTVPCAATDIKRELQMFYAGPNNEGGTTSIGDRFNTKPITVRGEPLADILTEDEIGSTRLIKIDVEGAEYSVVQGMRPVIPKLQDDAEIAVEISPSAIGPRNLAEIFSVFKTAGFFPYALDNSYDAAHCLQSHAVTRPSRLWSLPTTQTDVVFSKVDAERL
jgi:FkbM family methyltransferase